MLENAADTRNSTQAAQIKELDQAIAAKKTQVDSISEHLEQRRPNATTHFIHIFKHFYGSSLA